MTTYNNPYMTRYFFNQDGDLCHINTENDIMRVINIDTELIAKIKKDFYIDNEGNLFRIFTVGSEFGSTKIPSKHKFIDILNFGDNIFLVSDNYHLFIVDDRGHTCPKIIKFSNQVFPGMIKHIHSTRGICFIVLIHHENSVHIFDVKHNNFERTHQFIMEINNVTHVSFNDQSFTACIKNKYYDVSYNSVENAYVSLFMTTFIGSHIILCLLTLNLMCVYMPVSEASLISLSVLLLTCAADILIIKLKFRVLVSSIMTINKWILSPFTRYLCLKINHAPNNITYNVSYDDTIQIASKDGTVIYGNLVPITKPIKSARFLGNN